MRLITLVLPDGIDVPEGCEMAEWKIPEGGDTFIGIHQQSVTLHAGPERYDTPRVVFTPEPENTLNVGDFIHEPPVAGDNDGFHTVTYPDEGYEVQVYTNEGLFSYTIEEMSSALEHADLIMQRGVYRRSRKDGNVEFLKVIKTKVCGEGLESDYPDTFKRT